MHPDFWHQRWHENRIGFHQDAPTPLLVRHWDAISATPGSRVFVPLAGKSLDMAWLAARGHPVLGVELSSLAVRAFFDEHGLAPGTVDAAYGTHHRAAGIDLVRGDIFDLPDAELATCAALLDRAALIALPPPMRARYVREVHARLPAGCRGLLVTIEYPQHEKDGPPFSVREYEVRALYEADWVVDVLERRDILASQPGFIAEGVTALETVAYRLVRRS